MTDTHEPLPPPTIALTVAEAARSIGISENTFRRHVLTELRSVKVGRNVLIPVRELERWIELSARFDDGT